MNGGPVLRYSFPRAFQNVFSKGTQIYLKVMPIDEIDSSPSEGFSKAQWVAFCQYKGVTGHFCLTMEILLDPSFAFLLLKENEPDWFLCINDRKVIDEKKSKLNTNPNPFLLQQKSSPISTLTDPSIGLHVQKCTETADRYEIEVIVRGVQIYNKNGRSIPQCLTKNQCFMLLIIIISDITISTDRQFPSFSAHQLTLSVTPLQPLILQVPWPFLSDEILVSLLKKNKKKKKKYYIHLILKYSLNDPFPCEFGGRSKWDLNLLKPWQDIRGHGNLRMHVEAQFHCDHLSMEKYSFKNSSMSPVDEVRKIVSAIFYGNSHNLFFLFSICLADDPVLYLRVQPIVRFSPHGSPLIIVSVLDYQLALLLIAKSALDPTQ